MKSRTKIIIALSILFFIMLLALISAQAYFNNKEIELVSDRCYEEGGMPEVEVEFLALNYSFSCQSN